MALSVCSARVDETGLELVTHGTTLLPIACYHDDLVNESVPWHWHDELEAAVVIEGRGIVTAGENRFLLGPGEGFFVNSGVLHGVWPAEGQRFRFHSLVFHPRLVGGSLDSVFYQKYVLPVTENRAFEGLRLGPVEDWQGDVLSAIETAWQACALETPGYELRIRDALSRMMFHLTEHLPPAQDEPGGKVSRNAQRIKQMLLFIHDHYADPITTAQIAASATVSESECLRCFHTTIGTTPIQYLKQFRLQKAAQLLLSTQDKAADIAGRCGFSDISYFTKAFREFKGCTPGQFRAQK